MPYEIALDTALNPNHGKPQGVHGIEVKWAILDALPADISLLTNSSFDTKSPLDIDFEELDRGEKCFSADAGK
ncbi:hypothetical protein TREPR_1112 [Treponema primitia ZAS-2]|uniref:Uncharacterized protein n=1 Tax=Treponema primitia (strain ATCC BAA-887 / DSM 12427 / ZAS-2) TaxID=545694 RepID=F5YH92_TREPZ|nr:hypothetical protein [Treponema primitia]AEF85956.1 hypothetical protein TREPR_1112 [Treponema primitia ZAS-2]